MPEENIQPNLDDPLAAADSAAPHSVAQQKDIPEPLPAAEDGKTIPEAATVVDTTKPDPDVSQASQEGTAAAPGETIAKPETAAGETTRLKPILGLIVGSLVLF